MKHVIDPQQVPFRLTGARVAVLGYGPSATQHALGLRDAGNDVSVGMRSGGMSWVRARKDGFPARAACTVVEGASVVVVLVPDDEQASVYWHAIEPNVEPGALLVFGRALALETKAFEPRGVDVVFVAAHEQGLSRRGPRRRDGQGARARHLVRARGVRDERDHRHDDHRRRGRRRARRARDQGRERRGVPRRGRERRRPRARLARPRGGTPLVLRRAAASSSQERAARSGSHPADERGSAVSLVAGYGPRRGMS